MFSAFPISHFARHSVPPSLIGFDVDNNENIITTAISLTVPGTVIAGDVLVVWVGGHDADNISEPGGWTLIFEDNSFSREGSNRAAGYYYRVAGANDAGNSYQWIISEDSFFSSAACAGVLVAYRGVSQVIGYSEQDVAVLNATTHSYTVPNQFKDQYAVLLTGWYSMRSGGGNITSSSGDMTLIGEASESGGGGSGIHVYYLNVISPSDPLVGTSVDVDFSQVVDADTFAVILEGRFA